MNTARSRLVWSSLCVALTALLGSCNRNAAGPNPEAAGQQAKPGPKESLDRIMEDFRRKIEDIPMGFVVTGANTRSSMVGTNKVSYELVPPKDGDNRYKALVTIVSQTQYSFHRSKPTGEEADKDQNGSSQGQNTSTLNEKKSNTSISILDPTLAGKTTRSPSEANGGSSEKKDAAEEVVASRPDKQERKYELVYENGRWVLATKPDPKNEKSIQFAFDQALSSQG